MGRFTHRDLIVWQKAQDLALEIIQLADAMPRRASAQVIGTTWSFQDVAVYYTERGRFISDSDNDTRRRVAVIGETVRQNLSLPAGVTAHPRCPHDLNPAVLAEAASGALGRRDGRLLVPFPACRRSIHAGFVRPGFVPSLPRRCRVVEEVVLPQGRAPTRRDWQAISHRIRGTLPNGGPGNLLAARLHENIDDGTLDGLAARLGVEVIGRHTASGDALMTAAIFLRLIDLLEADGIVTLNEAIKVSNVEVELRRRKLAV